MTIPSGRTSSMPAGCGCSVMGLIVILIAMAAFGVAIWWLFKSSGQLQR